MHTRLFAGSSEGTIQGVLTHALGGDGVWHIVVIVGMRMAARMGVGTSWQSAPVLWVESLSGMFRQGLATSGISKHGSR